MENDAPADCILMNMNIHFLPSTESICFHSIFFFEQGKAKQNRKQWSELKQAESIGLKNKMDFSIGAMQTFVSYNHMAS